jgi:hypothetical protein
MKTNKTMEPLAPYAIDYTEQLLITGGRTVVTCVGNTFDPHTGASTYDCLYNEDGKEILVCEVPDNGRPPAVGTVLAVYP